MFVPPADKEAVEKRLFILQKQGHNIYTKTSDSFTWNIIVRYFTQSTQRFNDDYFDGKHY